VVALSARQLCLGKVGNPLTLVAMATKFGLAAEIQSPTGLFIYMSVVFTLQVAMLHRHLRPAWIIPGSVAAR